MFLNVWGFIWPNQKIALGIVEADADAKAKAARMAMLFSRTNTAAVDADAGDHDHEPDDLRLIRPQISRGGPPRWRAFFVEETMSEDGDDLDDLIRRVDPDRWLSSRFIADPAARADVIALYAYDHELARAPKVASNPLLGEIRLTWWREVLDEAFEGRPVRHHPTAQAIAGVIARRGLARGPLEAMIDARYRELDATPMTEIEALDWARGLRRAGGGPGRGDPGSVGLGRIRPGGGIGLGAELPRPRDARAPIGVRSHPGHRPHGRPATECRGIPGRGPRGAGLEPLPARNASG